MTEGLAIEVAAAKMRELEVGTNYLIRYRHFQLLPSQKMVLKMGNDIMILLTPEIDTRVQSRTGIYDVKDIGIVEMQYLHSGEITIDNQNIKLPIQVKFLQIIPTLTTP